MGGQSALRSVPSEESVFLALFNTEDTEEKLVDSFFLSFFFKLGTRRNGSAVNTNGCSSK